MLIIAGSFAIDPSMRDQAMAAAREMMVETHKEPGCIDYTFSADLTNPARFYIFERWESQAALEKHFATPHMARFQQEFPKVGAHDFKFEKYTISGVGPVF